MDPELLQIGGFVGGLIAVILLLERVWKMVSPLIDKGSHDTTVGQSAPEEAESKAPRRCVPSDVDLRKIEAQIGDLHEWHSRVDEDGAPVWYVRSSMTRAIEKMAESNEQTARVLERLALREEAISETVARIEGRLMHLDYDPKVKS